jgi:hypothetical protein
LYLVVVAVVHFVSVVLVVAFVAVVNVTVVVAIVVVVVALYFQDRKLHKKGCRVLTNAPFHKDNCKIWFYVLIPILKFPNYKLPNYILPNYIIPN